MLTLTLKESHTVFVGDTPATVAVIMKDCIELEVGGDKFIPITTDEWSEILPDVKCKLRPSGDLYPWRVRLMFDAPRAIKIFRAELRRR